MSRRSSYWPSVRRAQSRSQPCSARCSVTSWILERWLSSSTRHLAFLAEDHPASLDAVLHEVQNGLFGVGTERQRLDALAVLLRDGIHGVSCQLFLRQRRRRRAA